MTRDYKNAGHHVDKPLPGWIWLLTGLAMGLTVALLVYVNQPQRAPSAARPANTVSADPAPSARTGKAVPNTVERRFDFYTLLPELEVVVPENQARPAAENRARMPVPAQAAARGPYILQAGSFQRIKEADTLKANLALLGVEADIQTVTVDHNTWHRVRVGPYDNLAKLNRVRARLVRNQIDTVTLQER